MHKATHVFPIIGGRKVEQLEGNIEALNITLSEEQVKYLESVLSFEPGFPHNFVVSSDLLYPSRSKLTLSISRNPGRRLRLHLLAEDDSQLREVAPGATYPRPVVTRSV